MAQNQLFDLFGTDLFRAAIDQVLLAAFDDVVSGRVLPHQIAAAIKAVGGEGAGVVLWRAVIAAERVRAAAAQFADFARHDGEIILAEDQHLIVGADRPADSFHADVERVIEPDEHQQPFRHAEILLRAAVDEDPLGAPADLGLHALAAALNDTHRPKVMVHRDRAFGPADQQCGNDMDVRDAEARDQGKHILGARRRVQYDRCTLRQEALKARAGERQIVPKRQDIEKNAVFIDGADRGCEDTVVSVIIVSARDQLGDAGRPARQQEQRRVVGLDDDRVEVGRGTCRRPLDQRGERYEAFRRDAENNAEPQTGRSRADPLDHGGITEVPVRVGGDGGDGIGGFDEECHFAHAVRRQRQYRYRADLLQREVENDELDDVGQLDDEPVARPDAEVEQIEREIGRLSVEFGIRQRLDRITQCDPVCEAVTPALEYRAQGQVAPIAALAVQRGIFGRKRNDAVDHALWPVQLTKL